MDFGRVRKTWDRAARAKGISHERAAPRPEFGQDDRRRPTAIEPRLRQRQAEKLTEHLADLGRRGEIACHAERIARRVVSILGIEQTLGHELSDRDRTGGGDPLGELSAQRRQAAVSVRRSRRRDRSTRARPTPIIGSDST